MSAIISPVPSPVQPPGSSVQPSGAPKRFSRGKWLILGAIVLVAAGLGYWLRPKPKAAVTPLAAIRTAKAGQGTLERSVRVSGQTSARNYANIIAPLLRGPENRGSLILLKLAKAGATVRKGDMLAEIDAQSAQDHIDDTQAQVVQAKLDVDKRKAEQAVEMENLQQSLRVTKASLDKAKLDYSASEVRTTIDQELMKLAVEEADARYQQQSEDLKSKKISHAAQLRILEITDIRQDRHLGRHLDDIKRFSIKAPIEGLIVMATVNRGPGDMAQIQQGDQVYPGMPIMKVVNPASMQVEANVNQAESGDFRVGQETRISLDAFPGLQLKGKIYSIGALATGGWRQNFFIRNVPIRVAIQGADPRLIPDLSAAVDVIVEKAENAIIIPLGAVDSKDGKPGVWVKSGETFVRKEVELGLRNNTHVAVLAGLEAGEEVRLN